MSTKVKRYGYVVKHEDGSETRRCFPTKAERDADTWGSAAMRRKPITVTRTVRTKGRPLWWAIRQLQEGRAVVDGDGDIWYPTGVKHPDRSLFSLLQSVGCDGVSGTDDYAQSWTLAVQP